MTDAVESTDKVLCCSLETNMKVVLALVIADECIKIADCTVMGNEFTPMALVAMVFGATVCVLTNICRVKNMSPDARVQPEKAGLWATFFFVFSVVSGALAPRARFQIVALNVCLTIYIVYIMNYKWKKHLAWVRTSGGGGMQQL